MQAVARQYGLVFAGCNPDADPAPRAQMLAAAGARVAELATQVDAALAMAQPGEAMVATVMVGANDIWELYDAFALDPSQPTEALLDEARQRGAGVAAQLRRLKQAGVRVILSTVHDVGKSPDALAEQLAHPDGVDRARLITDMVFQFNAGLRVALQDEEINDGRYIGLVLADEMVQAMVKAPGGFGLKDASVAACTVAPPDCTSATLIEGASSANHLWADGRLMAYGGQVQLGLLAVSRANNNPF